MGRDDDAALVEAMARAIGDLLLADDDLWKGQTATYMFAGNGPYLDVDGSLNLHDVAQAALAAYRAHQEAR